jgi:hypothetical protein
MQVFLNYIVEMLSFSFQRYGVKINLNTSVTKKGCTPDNFDMFFGHIFFVILDILKIFCSNKHQIITDLLNYLDPIKS